MENCPHCGEKVLYQGLSALECNGLKNVCPNGTKTWEDKFRAAVDNAFKIRFKTKNSQPDNQTHRYTKIVFHPDGTKTVKYP